MKKLLTLALCILMSLSTILVGCGTTNVDEGNVTKAAAIPLGLGFDDPDSKGFPRIANKEETELLFQQLKNTCEPYGTKVTVDEDGMLIFTKMDA